MNNLPTIIQDLALTEHQYKTALKVAYGTVAEDINAIPYIHIAMSYCRHKGLDITGKYIHVVSYGKTYQLIPSIDLHRVIASRTGLYLGKDNAVLGQEITKTFIGKAKTWKNQQQVWDEKSIELTFPKYADVTVYRLVGKEKCAFTARAYWLESYQRASTGNQLPNGMWETRPYSQLEKCAEALALRMAFPEESAPEIINDDFSEIENVTPMQEKTPLTEIQAALSEPARPIEKDWLDWNGEDWSNWASSLNSALDACADNACVTSLAKENAKYMRFLESENPALFAAIKEKSDAVRKKLSEKPSILDVDVAPHDEPQLVDYSQVI
jgi:phage recombination protein Bet